jgi:hypothetical protein
MDRSCRREPAVSLSGGSKARYFRRRLRLAGVAALVAAIAAVSVVMTGALAGTGGGGPAFEVVASGLDNPRGIGFDSNGRMWVVEAGVGGDANCKVIAAGNYCYGETGAITRVETDGDQHRIVTGLPSLSPKDAGGVFANGPSDIKVASNGDVYVTIGMSAPAGERGSFGPKASQLSTLSTLNPNNTLAQVADFAPFELSHNPDKSQNPVDGHDTDAHSLLIDGNFVIVTDAGANDLLRVNRTTGKIRLLAAFPNRLVAAPPFAGGAKLFPIEAVPTAVVRDPQSSDTHPAYYVATLSGYPYPLGQARIYRVVPGKKPTLAFSGFTMIVRLAVGPDGSLYVLEITENSQGTSAGNPAAFGGSNDNQQGALIRVFPNGYKDVIASAGLFNPEGLAIYKGNIYVSNYATCPGTGTACPGTGEVIKIPLPS